MWIRCAKDEIACDAYRFIVIAGHDARGIAPGFVIALWASGELAGKKGSSHTSSI